MLFDPYDSPVFVHPAQSRHADVGAVWAKGSIYQWAILWMDNFETEVGIGVVFLRRISCESRHARIHESKDPSRMKFVAKDDIRSVLRQAAEPWLGAPQVLDTLVQFEGECQHFTIGVG